MNNKIYPSIRLEWGKVAYYIQKIISELLGRDLICTTKTESQDFWSVALINDVFTLSEIKILLEFVKADDRTVEETLPEDCRKTKYIGMLLSSELLKKTVNATWNKEHITEEALWLIDVNVTAKTNTALSPEICMVDSFAIDTNALCSAEELKKCLADNDGDYSALVTACQQNAKRYGHHLFWNYPITDGEHSGVYFVLVKEGVLWLPYNRIENNCFEQFIVSESKICSQEDIQNFIRDWNEFDKTIRTQMSNFEDFLERKT